MSKDRKVYYGLGDGVANIIGSWACKGGEAVR